MDAFQAVVLGIVEGLTEYLPVSSTGHLILAQRALGIPRTANADAFAVVIQAGAILAVLALYGARFVQVARGVLGTDADGRRLAVALAAAFLPAALIGVLFGSTLKALLFNLPAITAAWFVGGLAILLVARRRGRTGPDGGGRPLADLDWRLGLGIGVAQVLAMWPGTSRSLVTILAGLLLGLSMPAAVEFSFLLGAVTLTAASAKDFWDHGAGIVAESGWVNLSLGVATATIAAAASVKWMVSWLNRRGLAVFGWYRIALAIVVAVLILAGTLPAAV
jgi:undecaprenyl-diphosphatase